MSIHSWKLEFIYNFYTPVIKSHSQSIGWYNKFWLHYQVFQILGEKGLNGFIYSFVTDESCVLAAYCPCFVSVGFSLSVTWVLRSSFLRVTLELITHLHYLRLQLKPDKSLDTQRCLGLKSEAQSDMRTPDSGDVTLFTSNKPSVIGSKRSAVCHATC